VNYDDTDLVCHDAPSSRHRSATYVIFRKRRARHQAIRALEFTFAAARYPSICMDIGRMLASMLGIQIW